MKQNKYLKLKLAYEKKLRNDLVEFVKIKVDENRYVCGGCGGVLNLGGKRYVLGIRCND